MVIASPCRLCSWRLFQDYSSLDHSIPNNIFSITCFSIYLIHYFNYHLHLSVCTYLHESVCTPIRLRHFITFLAFSTVRMVLFWTKYVRATAESDAGMVYKECNKKKQQQLYSWFLNI